MAAAAVCDKCVRQEPRSDDACVTSSVGFVWSGYWREPALLTLLIALLLAPAQSAVTEADYREAVRCSAVARVAETWASGSDSLGERMTAEGYKTTADRLNGFAFQFGEYGDLAEEEVEANIDAASGEANRGVMASTTPAEFRTAKSALFRDADACTRTLMQFSARR